jgi:hypothetical protein
MLDGGQMVPSHFGNLRGLFTSSKAKEHARSASVTLEQVWKNKWSRSTAPTWWYSTEHLGPITALLFDFVAGTALTRMLPV